MKILKHIIRGCGDLPHLGPHPGTPIIFIFIILGALAGRGGGHLGMLGGALVMTVVFVPMYLIGAYQRSVESDQITETEK